MDAADGTGKPGTCFLDGRAYPVRMDGDGTWRFPANTVLIHLRDVHRAGGLCGLDVERALAVAIEGDLPAHDLAQVFMGLGYDIDGLLELAPFAGWDPVVDTGPNRTASLPHVEDGDVCIDIDGVSYPTDTDDDDRVAFRGNEVLMALDDGEPGLLGSEPLDAALAEGLITLPDYVAYEAMLGTAVVDTLMRAPFRGCVVRDEEDKPVVLPDLGFKAVHAAQDCDLVPARGPIGLSGLGDKVLYGTPLGDADYGPLTAYMQRRFGFPSSDGDHLTSICGSWCISSPDPDLFLFVSPSTKPAFSVFSPYMRTPGERDEYGRYVVAPERQAVLREAYRTALIDLIRPVRLDGNSINALGEVDHGSLLDDYPGHGDTHTFEADHSPAAASSIPVEIAGTREWDEMLSMLARLGDGEMLQGLGRLVAMGRKAILDDVRAGSRHLRILVAAGSVGPWHATVMEGLDLPADEVEEAGEVARAFLLRHQQDVTSLKVPDFAEDEAREATRILGSLGINAPMLKALRGYRHTCRLRVEFDRFCDLAKAGYPEELLDRDATATGLAAKLRGVGNEALAVEVERLQAEEEGTYLLLNIVTAYASRVARERREASEGPSAG